MGAVIGFLVSLLLLVFLMVIALTGFSALINKRGNYRYRLDLSDFALLVFAAFAFLTVLMMG